MQAEKCLLTGRELKSCGINLEEQFDMKAENIEKLLGDLENDRVERTISTTNTDKFGQAICAFANDLPGHHLPGYLILGANDDGSLSHLKVTDALLKNIAAIRTDGNIQPQPSMVVEKVTLSDGDVVVAEVQPASFPPVRYKGRIWIRVGPRKAVAGEADEKILYEKRVASIKTFDAMPCMNATVADLDTDLFEGLYLPKAVPEDVRKQDGRDVKLKLQALGFFDTRFDCPTYAGILMFGKQVERFLPGAYIQYVRFSGKGRGGSIVSEHKFSGCLCKVLMQLDTFVETTIARRRPVPVSALREDTIVDYPQWATRELLMNAICHRDYESNGPIQFYQYDDRIEILNPGGLYGKANAKNFPLVNDYRNSVLAEAMKVLGFVNRFSRGVIRVEEELEENGNGKPKFNLDLVTAFLVVENISEKSLMYAETELTWGQVGVKLGTSWGQDGDKMGTSKEEIAKLLNFCKMPKSSVEIMTQLGKKSRDKFWYKLLRPLLELSILARTIPDKPKSKKQKYVTTIIGLQLLDNQSNIKSNISSDNNGLQAN